jgi:hypothetical protein
MTSHFSLTKLTSPHISITAGYGYVLILGWALYYMGFYKDSTFFSFGVPITLMGKTINEPLTYYALLLLFFFHQLINNWINDAAYPWIINSVQDPKSKSLEYTRRTSLLLVNLFALYSEIDVILIVAGVMSSISFFLVIILANLISTTLINWQYIRVKKEVNFEPLLNPGDSMV